MPHSYASTLPLRARPGIVLRLIRSVTIVATRRRDRQRLGQLDAHLLRDIGLEAQVARRESVKPFWQP